MAGVTSDDPAASQAVSMILMGLLTFLAIILSYRWFQSNQGGQRKNTKTTEDQKSKAKGDASNTKSKSGSKMEDDDDSSTIDDVLVKASDIKPVDAATLQQMSGGDNPMQDTIEDVHKQHHKAKELEEEVAKTLSQEQLEEEAKVRQNQLAAIFKLMEENKDRFGVDSMTDVQEQYKLYN
ncbi:uncharacterized protein [Amphiura filiformis]|uniref:uncharacterized protein n=1 Tax=Amphiura filiformis TaxID=82378 RepID=UPI003B21762A